MISKIVNHIITNNIRSTEGETTVVKMPSVTQSTM
jgi:hypothetical protein